MTTQLHLQHVSLLRTATPQGTRADLVAALKRGADLVSLTEVSRANGKAPIARAVCAEYGYQLVSEHDKAGGETALCVRLGGTPGNPEAKVLATGSELISPGVASARGDVGYAARYLTWAQIEWQGERVFMVTGHWVTGAEKRAERLAEHERMTRRVVSLVREHGAGEALAFWSGDLNLDEKRDRGENPRLAHALLTTGELSSVWDELGVYPATHGRVREDRGTTLDAIGSYDRDGRVIANAAQVYPKGNSDHCAISVWYDIAPRQARVRDKVHDCPTCGHRHPSS